MIYFMNVNFIEDNCNIVNNGQFNMDFDVKMLDFAIENQIDYALIRFYQWYPKCISLGRNQKKDCYNNLDIDVVVRPSGGRALLHDNELTYSFVCPIKYLKYGESVINSYKEISGALALGLKAAGIEADFPKDKKASASFEYCMSLSTGADLSYNGRKIAGSAQFRKQGYILQHGSIMFSYNPDLIQNIFGEEPQADKITTLNEIAPNLGLEQLCKFLKSGFEEYFNADFSPCSSAAFEKP